MENIIRKRIIYKENNNNSRKINIILPRTLNELVDKCNEILKLNDQFDLTFIATFFEKSDIKITKSNYNKILESDDAFYEIEMIKKEKKIIIKNEKDYLLAKKENEDNIHIDRNNNEFLFKFTLINKGNFTWKKPFKISNETINNKEYNKNKLTCTTQVIYEDVEPNDEIECEVNILELNKKDKNSILRIKIFKSDNSKGKYPDNCVEYNFIIE